MSGLRILDSLVISNLQFEFTEHLQNLLRSALACAPNGYAFCALFGRQRFGDKAETCNLELLSALSTCCLITYSCSSASLAFTLRVLGSTYCSSKALEDMSTRWSSTVCTAMVSFPCFGAGHIYGRQVLCLQRIGAAHFGVRLGMGRVSASVWQGSSLRHSCD